MAVAPPIQPVESDVHLLTTIAELPADLRAVAMTEGLTFNTGWECLPGKISAWPIGCNPALDPADEDTWKVVTSVGGDISFKSFLVHMFVDCGDSSGSGGLNPMIDERRAPLIMQAFDVGKHIGVARQLWYGSADTTNPTLRSTASLATDGATAVELVHGISKLVAERKELASGPVFVHGPWILVPILQHLGVLSKVNGRYEGLGFIYVVDEGYPSTGNMGPRNGGTDEAPTYYPTTTGTVWLYATGRVEYAWGGKIDNQTLGLDAPASGRLSRLTVWDPSTNRWLARVEQQAFLRFDPCAILAQQVTVP